ncbi:MAG: phosphoribosylanthranilate isomerase [Gemmatimonadota bacterium]|nr:MAG: phosphoribosylanthranilate isomerase [Gemmatimonadota bacterium]
MSPTRFKVCCIGGPDEASLAIRYGASAIGLVSAMPSGPGVIGEELIRRIAASTPPAVSTFLLTSLTDPAAIAEQHRRCATTAIQLVDRMEASACEELRAARPGVRLVQVVHVTGPAALGEAVEAARYADALLLDSGRPDLAVKELGGTGRVHDWAVSRAIREAVEIPVFLAGGLGPRNVAEAVRAVEPYAVDVCSGVRTGGRLDEDKLARFAAALA